MNLATAKQNLVYGRSMKHASNEARLLYFVAYEICDSSGIFDVTYALDTYKLPMAALTELVEAKLLLYFEDQGTAVIIHWNIIATANQRGKASLFPEAKNRLVTKNGKYYLKNYDSDNTDVIYMN